MEKPWCSTDDIPGRNRALPAEHSFSLEVSDRELRRPVGLGPRRMVVRRWPVSPAGRATPARTALEEHGRDAGLAADPTAEGAVSCSNWLGDRATPSFSCSRGNGHTDWRKVTEASAAVTRLRHRAYLWHARWHADGLQGRDDFGTVLGVPSDMAASSNISSLRRPAPHYCRRLRACTGRRGRRRSRRSDRPTMGGMKLLPVVICPWLNVASSGRGRRADTDPSDGRRLFSYPVVLSWLLRYD